MKTPEEMAEEYVATHWDGKAKGVPVEYCKEDFLAGYKAAQQWISVKDRLPEIDKYVLVTHRTSQDYTNLKVMEACRISDDEYEIWGDYAILADYVDYWMPLPAPPKEEK